MRTPVDKQPKKRRLIDELIEGTIALKDDREGRIVLPRIYVEPTTTSERGSKKAKAKKKTR